MHTNELLGVLFSILVAMGLFVAAVYGAGYVLRWLVGQ